MMIFFTKPLQMNLLGLIENKKFLFLFLFLPSVLFSQLSTVYVDAVTGSDIYTGEHQIYTSEGTGPKSTIDGGLKALANNGTLVILAGSYNGGNGNGSDVNISTENYPQITTSITIKLVSQYNTNIINLTSGSFIFSIPSGSISVIAETAMETLSLSSGNLISIDGNLKMLNNIFGISQFSISGDLRLYYYGITNYFEAFSKLSPVFTGASDQLFVLNGDRSIGSITLNKSVSSAKVKIDSGNVFMNGKVTLNRGLLATGQNFIKLLNTSNSSEQGYTRHVASGEASHIVGNVKKTIRTGFWGYNEFPVGSSTSFCPATITIIDSVNNLKDIELTVSQTGQGVAGTIGLPIADGVSPGIAIESISSFCWSIKSNIELDTPVKFDIELTAGGFTGYKNINDIRIVRRKGAADNIYEAWNMQSGHNYENYSVSAIPTVILRGASGGISTEGATFAYGFGDRIYRFKNINLAASDGSAKLFLPDYYKELISPVKYTVSSANLNAAVTDVQNDTLFIYPESPGFSEITVIAAAANNDSSTDLFYVTVNPDPTWTAQGFVIYANKATTPLKNVNVILAPGNYSGTSDSSGSFSVPNLPNGTYCFTASSKAEWLTDAVSSADALLAAWNTVDPLNFPLDNIQVGAADVNNDGKINSTDALLIMRRIVRLDNSFSKGDWVFDSGSIIVNRMDPSPVTIKALAVGDVNGSAVFSGSSSKANLVNEDWIEIKPDEQFSIPVVTGVSDISAITFIFRYPEDLADFSGVTSNLNGILWKAENGEIRIVWADMQGKNPFHSDDKTNLITLNFKPTEKFKAGKSFSLNMDLGELVGSNGKVINSVIKTFGAKLSVPSEYALKQNYPNPFNPSTIIEYDLPVNSHVTLTISNILGQEVAALVDGLQEAGTHKVSFNAANLTSGIYFYTINASDGSNKFIKTYKMILLR